MNRVTIGIPGTSERRSGLPFWIHYGLLVVCPLQAIVMLSGYGSGVGSPDAVSAPAPPPLHQGHLLQVLAAMAVVLMLAQLCGAIFARCRQPRVLGEVVAGLLLGPSVLGVIAPGAAAYFLSPSLLPTITTIGQLGLVLFLFLVGLEFDFTLFRRQGPAAL